MLEGYIDTISKNQISGWIWDSNYPNIPLEIALLNREYELIAIELANEFRGDIFKIGKGNGAHGFNIHFAETCDLSGAHLIAVKSGFELKNSHILNSTLTINTTPKDSFDTVHRKLHQLKQFSKYIDNLNQTLSNKFSALGLRLKEIKDQFGVIHNNYEKSQTNIPLDIFIFPPIDWYYRVQRPQRLASHLALLGCRVWYISIQMLPTNLHYLPYLVYDEPSPGVFLIKFRCDYPHSVINVAPLNQQTVQSIKIGLTKIIEDMKITRMCFLLGSAGWQPVLNILPKGLVIYDLMDWIAGFNATDKSLLDIEQQLIQQSDILLCSSTALQDYAYSKCGCTDILLLRNATHSDMFSLPPPSEKPIVGYVGAIEHWFDCELVIKTAQALPEIEFILVGYVAPINYALKSVANISCVGECEADKVASYVKQFHVGIIPFLDNELIRHTDPVKAYEYLAAGRSVVATNIPELQRFGTAIKLTNTHEEFIAAVKLALKNATNLKLDYQVFLA